MEAVREAIAEMRNGAEKVVLWGKILGDEEAEELAVELAKNSTLATLFLGANSIGADGCAALASAIQSPHSVLIALNLGWNWIGSDGCAALASALESPHVSLTALDLGHNDICNVGASALVASLEKNTSLLHMDLRENDRISTPVKARILALVQLSRDGVTDVPRDLVANLPDELLQQVSFTTYKPEITYGEHSYVWTFECIANFKPVLSALRDVANAGARQN